MTLASESQHSFTGFALAMLPALQVAENQPFVEVPSPVLESIATGNDRIPQLYFRGNPLARRIFWLRLRWIHRMARRSASSFQNCLDFGGGGGVFLPALSGLFGRVVCLDLHTAEASRIVAHFRLANTSVVQADATTVTLEDAPFDVIVAADVLEHFRDLAPPVLALRRLLRDDGILLTSLPTENFVYVVLRKLLGVEKPDDHYHTGYEVETFLAGNGFRRIQRRFVPFHWRILPLYLVSAWRRGSL